MDVVFLHLGQRFVWDAEKASKNVAKHEVSFEKACQVFLDPFLHLEDASTTSESRDAVIGLTEELTLLFVVHISLEADAIRIISARTATAQERRSYEDPN
jgi:uncharacterized DUF497 family protein